MSKLGDIIRRTEYEINKRVSSTKTLALNDIKIELEKGGSI